MKRKIDALVALDEELQQFLTWVNHKSLHVQAPHKQVTSRIFYTGLIFGFINWFADVEKNYALIAFKRRYCPLPDDFELDKELIKLIVISSDVWLININQLDDYDLKIAIITKTLPSIKSLEHGIMISHERNFQRVLEELKLQLPYEVHEQPIEMCEWWQANSQAWTEQLRAVMIEHRNIGHDWQFSDAQKELLQQYYDANKLLVDCLNSDCYVSHEVRQEIEDTLLLPMTEIEQRQR